MSAVSHIGSMMNMAGMNMMDMPKDLTAAIPQMAGASSTNFGADLLSLSPMIGMLQQLADMDISQSGDGGEVDLGGLANLKQRGEMLANMLSMKIKNFETNLVSSMKKTPA